MSPLLELFAGQTATHSGASLLVEHSIELPNRPDVALWRYAQAAQ